MALPSLSHLRIWTLSPPPGSTTTPEGQLCDRDKQGQNQPHPTSAHISGVEFSLCKLCGGGGTATSPFYRCAARPLELVGDGHHLEKPDTGGRNKVASVDRGLGLEETWASPLAPQDLGSPWGNHHALWEEDPKRPASSSHPTWTPTQP